MEGRYLKEILLLSFYIAFMSSDQDIIWLVASDELLRIGIPSSEISISIIITIVFDSNVTYKYTYTYIYIYMQY